MGRKPKRNSASKSSSRRGETWDVSAFSMEDVEDVEEPRTKSTKSIIKSGGKYNGEKKGEGGKANGKSNKKEISQSDNVETDDLPKQKSWFWKRRKSGDKANDEAKDEEKEATSISYKSVQTKTTQANRNTKTIEDCETEYHEAIRDHNWDVLEGLLKEYDPTLYKKPKKASKRKKQHLKQRK